MDTLELRIPAGTVLRSDERGLPHRLDAGRGHRLRLPRAAAIGGLVLDNAFTNLERAADGVARVGLRDPESGAGRTLWVEPRRTRT